MNFLHSSWYITYLSFYGITNLELNNSKSSSNTFFSNNVNVNESNINLSFIINNYTSSLHGGSLSDPILIYHELLNIGISNIFIKLTFAITQKLLFYIVGFLVFQLFNKNYSIY